MGNYFSSPGNLRIFAVWYHEKHPFYPMQKNLLFATIIVFASLLLISFAKATKEVPAKAKVEAIEDSTVSKAAKILSEASALFAELDLGSKGLDAETVQYAVNGYHKIDDAGKVDNPYLTIIDMEQSSRKKRMYIIDMANHKLVKNTFVSHGRNSGVDKATRFSNAPNSYETSLGFYTTGRTYQGKHGLSLRLHGLEKGFNSNAEARAIVVHGAEYVNPARVNSAYMGRSLGCPAVPVKESKEVIKTIQDGSVLFIYHPSKNYLQSSDYING
jgi:hypothetical protein